MKTLSQAERTSFTGGQLPVVRQQPGFASPETLCVPSVTPAYERLLLHDRMNMLFPTKNHLGAYTPLRERKEVYSPSRLFELDLASYSPVGSFKYRGAWNAITSVPYETLLRHEVMAASAGNHALGVAMTLNRLNELYQNNKYMLIGKRRVSARIFVPTTAAPTKIEQIKQVGGDDVELVVCGESYDEADALMNEELKRRPGSISVHPYDDEAVIAGQSMCGEALVSQLDKLDTNPTDTVVVVPVGGGGLLAGVIQALHRTYPDPKRRPKVIGAQAEGADSAAQTWRQYKETGLLMPVAVAGEVNRFADGTAVKQVGNLPMRYLPHVDGFITVTNKELAKGYTDTLDSIAMNLMDDYDARGINPFFGLHEPASMIAEVAANKFAAEHEGLTVINLKTGINYNPELLEQLLQNE